MTDVRLPQDRAELRMPDAKPRYSSEEARAEAIRCLYCFDAPCVHACPTEIDIPNFIRKIASGDDLAAARTILDSNMLGVSCARVCPVEVLCVGACVYNEVHRPPIQIGKLQRYATETTLAKGKRVHANAAAPSGRKVAMIGAGPASLACAGYLAQSGVEVVVHEKRPLPGGLNTTGVAPYKLHAHDALAEVDYIRSFGVTVVTESELGRDLTPSELLEGYDALFVGVGLGADTPLRVEAESGAGVIGAIDFIERVKLGAAALLESPGIAGVAASSIGDALVVGGGNTAIDVVRELLALGVPRVSMVYRRTPAEMPGYAHEWAHARAAGAQMVERTVVCAFRRGAGGELIGVTVQRAERGRGIAGTERELAADLVVVAIGQARLGSLVAGLPGVALDGSGCVVVDPVTCQTAHPKVFAGGDCVNGGKEVVNAAADGRRAAQTMLARWGLRSEAIERHEGRLERVRQGASLGHGPLVGADASLSAEKLAELGLFERAVSPDREVPANVKGSS